MSKNSALAENETDQATKAKKVKKQVKNSFKKITSSSTAEYFSKNLQQVGFSSPTKAVLTTLKEAFDNSLDACEEYQILPEISVVVEKLGAGSMKNTDKIKIFVEDNGPGIDIKDVPKVFGEYLASSKFGRGRCSRGQQGIGISAATTWAMQTTATGVNVITKQVGQKKAFSCIVDVDIKKNQGLVKEKNMVDWPLSHGTSVNFVIDGRIKLNGEGGIMNYLKGNVLVNPHLTLRYNIPEQEPGVIERVTNEVPLIPPPTEPHPHTMKLGEFISHARLFGSSKVRTWLQNGFSRVSEKVLTELVETKVLPGALLARSLNSLSEEDFSDLYKAIQNAKLMAPSTQTVLGIGEEALAKSILRLGDIDFFSVLSRKPTICDFKPVQVEVAIARLKGNEMSEDETVQVLRFANRVPLQFDKASCAIVKAITTVNWKPYGLKQPRGGLPQGPYIIAVSVVSPFIKFKNASKETIDGSDELVDEIRRALIMAGQRLSRHLKREYRANELEEKIQHLEKFGPILLETLTRITGASVARRKKAEEGLVKILGRDTNLAAKQLKEADQRLEEHLELQKEKMPALFLNEDDLIEENGEETEIDQEKIDAEREVQDEDSEESSVKESKPKTKDKSGNSKKRSSRK